MIFKIDYSKDIETVEVKGTNVTNPIEDTDLLLIKLSTSAAIKDETGLFGEEYVDELDLDSLSQEILQDVDNLSKEQIIDLFKNSEEEYIKDLSYLLQGAEYSIYLDEECTEPLKLKDGTEVKIETGEYD